MRGSFRGDRWVLKVRLNRSPPDPERILEEASVPSLEFIEDGPTEHAMAVLDVAEAIFPDRP